MTLTTRLTEYFGIEHPILSAPMALASGGRLAAAVTGAGGLGLIGGGYGDPSWLRTQITEATGARVGYGFITWRLTSGSEALDLALAHRPAAVMLSFGDLHPFADRIRGAGVPLIGQIQTVAQARRALQAGVDVLVAQGGEAGGHGMSARSTFTLLPEVADLVAAHAPETLVVAAGGVVDGRGLAAALMLGADGVLVGTRLWASREALVSPRAQRRALDAGGDDTYRTGVYDIVRGLDWRRSTPLVRCAIPSATPGTGGKPSCGGTRRGGSRLPAGRCGRRFRYRRRPGRGGGRSDRHGSLGRRHRRGHGRGCRAHPAPGRHQCTPGTNRTARLIARGTRTCGIARDGRFGWRGVGWAATGVASSVDATPRAAGESG